jgi:ABC-type nitrate/sulfonate/bicarbonate transport system substrate-binding protein
MIDRFVRWCAACIALLILAPFAGANAQAPPVLRVGLTPNDTYAEAYYALDNGFFQQAGLSVELTTLSNGAAVSAAVASGALDVGVSTPIQLAQAATRGVPFVIVAAGAVNTVKVPAALICVAAGSTIRDAKGLQGKTVAVNALKTSSEELLDAWLEQNGVERTSVHTIEMPFSAMGEALKRGAIDGAILSEPSLSIATKRADVRVLANPTGAVGREFLLSAWFATTQYAQKNRDAMKRFATAIYQTARWANAHHDESAAILAKYAKLDINMIQSMTRAPFADSLRVRDVQPQLDAALKYGLVTRPVAAAEILSR